MEPTIDIISAEALRAIAQLVRDLTELRLRGTPHLCIENFAPEIFAKLLLVYQEPDRYASAFDAEWFGRYAKGDSVAVGDSDVN